MGYAHDHLSGGDLEAIAKGLFKVTSTDSTRGELIGLCPIHGEKNPSFAYNYLKDAYFCKSCEASGDIIDLWCQVNGHTNQKEGFKAFLKEHNVEQAPSSTSNSQKKPATPKKKEAPPPQAKPIPDDIWAQMPTLPPSWVARLKEVRGWSLDTIVELDLRLQSVYLNPKNQEICKINGKPDRIAIPIRDSSNKILYNIRLYKQGAKVRKIMSWGKGYGKARLFPSPALLKPDLPVLICEGEADTICARSQGLNAITQTSKLTKWPDDQLKHFKDRDCFIAYDADQAGQKYAHKAATSLQAVAKSIRFISWPDYMGKQADGEWPEKHGQDLTDFFIKHKKSIDDFQELIGQAKEFSADPDEIDDSIHSSEFFKYNSETHRSSFKPRYLADRILQDIPLMFDPKTGLLYKWGGKHWEEYFEEIIKKRCLQYLGDESTSSRANDATNQAMLLSTIAHGREVNDNPGLICINNGMINLEDLTLKQHDKDYYCTYKLDVDFNANSDKICTRWLSFLNETIQTAKPIEQLQEFMGYCFTRDTRYAKALFAFGPGADGKSTVLKILRNLCGPQNVSAVSFKDMEDQFYRSAIYNKLLNISTEVGSKAMESQYFKAIVTGDPIMAAFKNKTPFEFIPFCKLAFATNKLPRVLDNTDGYFRRPLLISFKQQFFGKDRDNSLEETLNSELSEIFAWALVGLHRLWEQDGFTECSETNDLMLGYKRLNNPVLCFVEDICEIGESEDHKVPKDDLYAKYKSYCSRNGYTQMHKENFFRELKTAVASLKSTRPTIDGERTQCVSGIKLNDSASALDDESN